MKPVIAISATTAGHKPTPCDGRRPPFVFHSRRMRLKPIARNEADKVGDIRPGNGVVTDAKGSLNSTWSIPKFSPRRYYSRVAAPAGATRKARARAIYRAGVRAFLGNSSHKEIPERTSSSAMFGFMESRAGRTDTNDSMWNVQPKRTKAPTATTRAAAILQAACNSLNRPGLAHSGKAPAIEREIPI